MRTGLIAFGVIFLVLGAVLYYMPTPTTGATTTTIGEEGVDTKTAYASVNTPVQLVIAMLGIGAILLVLGLALPDPNKREAKGEEGYTIETSKHVESGKGKDRHIIHEEHERRVKKAV